MKYLKIVNTPLEILLKRNGSIDWESFGMVPATVSALLLQRPLGDLYIQLLPLTYEDVYLTREAELQAIIDATTDPDDSIEVITEEEADALKILMLAE